MRFLIFNAVVALALLYLFNGDGGPEDKAKAALGSVKTFAAKAVDEARGRLDKPKPPARKAAASKPVPKPVPETKPEPVAEPAPPAPVERHAEVLPPPAPAPMPSVPSAPVETVTVAGLDEPAAPPPEPEVAKRRAEVLADSTEPADTGDRAVEIGGDGLLMSVDERRKALLRLAEDMELFSVGVTGR
jgi:outer membrane biosynthesis protein TonB